MNDQPAPASPDRNPHPGVTAHQEHNAIAYQVDPQTIFSVPNTLLHLYHDGDEEQVVRVFTDSTAVQLVGPGDWTVSVGTGRWEG